MNPPDRIFVWVIFLSILTELTPVYFGIYKKMKNFNYFTYNLLIIFSYPLFLWYYRMLKIKFPFFLLLGIFVLGVLYSIFFEDFFDGYYFVSSLFGSLTVVVAIFFCFYDILQKKELENLTKNSTFLFSSGLMIFYLGIIPYFLLSKYLLQLSQMSEHIIIITLNIILYTFYILAFLCSRRKTY